MACVGAGGVSSTGTVGHVPLQAKKENKTRMDKFWTENYRPYEDIVGLKTSEQEHAASILSTSR